MRAAVLREPGPAENLRLEDVDDPTPGPGEVVVRLRAAGTLPRTRRCRCESTRHDD